LRCVLDGELRTPPDARLLREELSRSPVLVYASPDADPERRRALEAAGATVVALGPPGGAVPPEHVLRDLGARGVLGVVVEGGGETHGHFLRAGMADKVLWYTSPTVLGDPFGRSAVAMPGPVPLGEARRLRIAEVARLDDDLLLTLYPR
jgi:diaminohydroxyphosphoribosylaminopyrimidine deaminase/5-amino-6-(5-phosphoribosylamino)uracil reductase